MTDVFVFFGIISMVSRALNRAIDKSFSREKRLTKKRYFAIEAVKAFICSMPMVIRMTHLTYWQKNWLAIVSKGQDIMSILKIQKCFRFLSVPSSTPIIFPHELQYSANTPSKHLTQNGFPFFMMYRWPPRCVWHSAQQKWVTCQGLPSASVQFSDRISYKITFKFNCYCISSKFITSNNWFLRKYEIYYDQG